MVFVKLSSKNRGVESAFGDMNRKKTSGITDGFFC